MDIERIAKMTENIASDVLAGESQDVPVSHVRTAEATPDEDTAMSNCDQAFDTMVAAIFVINDNLPLIKTSGVPEKAAVDAIKDLMDNAVSPYLADALKAWHIFGA